MSVIEFPSPAKRPQQQMSFLYDEPDDRKTALPVRLEVEPPDAEERRKALDITRSWIVEAPAGSGKTGLLIQRYLKLLTAVDEPDTVLALTFTNKATAEMRHRVLEMLERAAAPPREDWSAFDRQTWSIARDVLQQDAARGWRLREQPQRLNIRTIDSFCGEIARALPVLSGGIGLARPVPDASELYRTAAKRVLLRLGGDDAALHEAIETVLLQRDGNLADCQDLLAQMLATREQWGELVPLRSDLLHDAALDAEVRPRLDEALESTICSALSEIRDCCDESVLHELARIAHSLSEADGHKSQPNPFQVCLTPLAPGVTPTDLEHWRALANLVLTKGGSWRQQFHPHQVGVPLSPEGKERVLAVIASLQENERVQQALCAMRELPPERYPDEQWRVAKALFILLRHALVELRLLFAEREVCDFPELSMTARGALRDGEGAERLSAANGMRLEHLLVDEMQDTSSSQYELLESLTAGWDGRSQTVFLVGDPKQSIYLFRQARVERFIGSMRSGRLGEILLDSLHLTANFRSGGLLVSKFNAMFAEVFAGEDGSVGYRPADAVRAVANEEELRWHTDALGATSDRSRKIAERRRADREEAEGIAKLAHDWRTRSLPEGRREPWKIAVLVRARNHVTQVTRMLAEAGVPFRAVEIQRLNERPEVLDCLALTRALLHPADRVAWLAVLRAPWCGLSLAELHTLAAGDQAEHQREALRGPFRERIALLQQPTRQRVERTLDVMDVAIAQRGRAPVSQEVERAWFSLGGDLVIDALARTNVRRYFELLEEMESRGEAVDARRLGRRVEKLFAEPATAPDAVDVMTIHKAKGLEWDLVLVPGLQKGGGRSPMRLLDWMELPTRGRDGHAQVLLAPIAARGDEPGDLNTFIRKQRTMQERAELKRLLYVVTTRARTSLQIFASPWRTVRGEIERREGSLLKAAGASVTDEFAVEESRPRAAPLARAIPLEVKGLTLALAASAGERDGNETESLPERSRLPLAVAPRERLQAMAAGGTKPAPPGPVRESYERPQGSISARALGNAVHAFLEHLARRIATATGGDADVARLRQEVYTWRNRIEAVVRSGGLPSRETQRIASETMTALENTLADAEGRWLLEPHAGAVSEAEIAVEATGNEVRRLRMDRSFFAGRDPFAPGQEVLWIVDYKTAGHSLSDLEEFLRGERQKYDPQMRAYAEARTDLAEGTTVMLALYHPMVPKLQYWRYEP